jgi:hypothetical protein
MKVGDLVKKVHGLIDLNMIGIIIDATENPEEGFRRKITVATKKGHRKWMTNSLEVISESR